MATSQLSSILDQIIRDVKGSWRYRWHALGVAWLLCLAGWLTVLSMPDVYEARARVFVDTSSRLRDVLGTIAFAPDVESRINIVQQAMLGTPQLQKVAERTGLLEQAETSEEEERMLARLFENISVTAGRARANENLFTITYQNPDRAMAVAVVDTLLTSFVEDVLQQKAQGADAAQEFLRDQIDHYSQELAAADQRLAEFKRENVGLLPGDDTDYFQRMQGEVAALEQLRSDLRVAQSRREELRRQLDGERPFLPEGVEAADGTTTGTGLDVDRRIAELEQTLDELLLRYTERHPEVVGVREQLAQVRERREQELSELMGEDGGAAATNPVYQSARIALNDADVQVAALQARIDDRETKVAELRQYIDTMPEVEAELSRLTRNYASTKATYDRLLAQLERERLVNEGDDREVVNFQVIDPPRAPLAPVAPRRTLLLLGVLVMSFGGGGALAYVLNMIRPAFADATQLRTTSGLPVIGTVVAAWSSRQQAVKRLGFVAYGALAGCLVMLGGATIVFHEYGVAFMQQLLG